MHESLYDDEGGIIINCSWGKFDPLENIKISFDIIYNNSYTFSINLNINILKDLIMSTVKTGISINKKLFKKAEEIALKLDIPRSKLYQLALENYIRLYENRQILEKINNIYSDEITNGEQNFQNLMKTYHKKTLEDKW